MKRSWSETDAKTDSVFVSKLLVHPIKSCKGTAVEEWPLKKEGLLYDRLWCVSNASTGKVLTARDIPKMVLIHPRIDRGKGTLEVRFPDDSGCDAFSTPLDPTPQVLSRWETLSNLFHFSVHGLDGYICQSSEAGAPPDAPSASLSKFLGLSVHLVIKGPNPRYCQPTHAFPTLPAKLVFQDGYPLLVTSEESLKAVSSTTNIFAAAQNVESEIKGLTEKWKDSELEIERFRPNIVLKGAGVPFAEDLWEEITIASNVSSSGDAMHIVLVSPCTRCLASALPNVDPATGVRDAAVPFKVLMKFRTGVDAEPQNRNKACFGVNGIPRKEGVIRVGDRVEIRRFKETF
ncbi:hypothetical protein PUNSTDRAFT_58474 [Punctularia strigosozonata HHB-11173 SS5]|uniref:uncharacterized protein n=1 Tax=Punctularia strigosozonata (strain HHB-11173) TaxID=741275 RepID=UPI0004418276|nr:uncharacterized protein PUNSTDRAFT_58474 [Punctularia strigosozonata HHB-11173 SS5]EIN14228.1 hypothetical protein PUNSTDRAFT_58474 [Punctularia strigosozonata HHB-11173 SS5]